MILKYCTCASTMYMYMYIHVHTFMCSIFTFMCMFRYATLQQLSDVDKMYILADTCMHKQLEFVSVCMHVGVWRLVQMHTCTCIQMYAFTYIFSTLVGGN